MNLSLREWAGVHVCMLAHTQCLCWLKQHTAGCTHCSCAIHSPHPLPCESVARLTCDAGCRLCCCRHLLWVFVLELLQHAHQRHTPVTIRGGAQRSNIQLQGRVLLARGVGALCATQTVEREGGLVGVCVHIRACVCWWVVMEEGDSVCCV